MKTKTFVVIIAVIFAVFFMLMFYGGSKKGTKPVNREKVSESLSKPFKANAEIRLEDMELSASINKKGEGSADVSITKPESLKDITASFDGENITLGYKGMEVKLNKDSAVTNMLIKAVISAIDKASADGGLDIVADDNGIKLSGSGENGEFELQLNKADYSIAKISLPQLDLECEFNEFIFN